MAGTYRQPRQGPDYKRELCDLVNQHINNRGWNPARLAKESGQSKATISRITNYAYKGHTRPSPKTIQAITLALGLTKEQRTELFYVAYPELAVYEEAAEKGWSVMETNEELNRLGLSLLIE